MGQPCLRPFRKCAALQPSGGDPIDILVHVDTQDRPRLGPEQVVDSRVSGAVPAGGPRVESRPEVCKGGGRVPVTAISTTRFMRAVRSPQQRQQQ